ncbi:hypothetical protein SAMN05421786_101542 [Chryseobacterium ureilyticum]|uniref:Uncharacterized protein n=1 Tax=Chryseobacterium ureilyticum TaxID=373668 RepID=A0A1N7KJX8_9FLAO|nr:hypothetical protein SAMN05421786_101542 [Chryseobacterium ureilyticum]
MLKNNELQSEKKNAKKIFKLPHHTYLTISSIVNRSRIYWETASMARF